MTITTPTINADGTIDAIIAQRGEAPGTVGMIRLHLPATVANLPLSGRYFLARCGAQTLEERSKNWTYPLRKPIFVCNYRPTQQVDSMPVGEWLCLLPDLVAPAYSWLYELEVGARVNLLGPFGNGFQLNPITRRLLILADSERSLVMLALIDSALDAGKKVTVAVKSESMQDSWLANLALAVEVQTASDQTQWQAMLLPLLRWADQLCTTLPLSELAALASSISAQRGRCDPGFAQVLVEADLSCAVGACLACVVPQANGGFTRACVHGPVLDLHMLC